MVGSGVGLEVVTGPALKTGLGKLNFPGGGFSIVSDGFGVAESVRTDFKMQR